jgi:hypothetical protein
MKSEQKRRAIQMINAIKTRGSTVSLDAVADLLQEMIWEPDQSEQHIEMVNASAQSVPDWLETTRFLTDVTTAAGLLEHGRRDKGLARRIGDFANKYRMIAPAPAAPTQPDPELAKDAELLDALEDEVKSRGTHGLTLYYVKHTKDGYVFEKGFRAIGRKFIGPRKATLREAIDAAMAAEKGGA